MTFGQQLINGSEQKNIVVARRNTCIFRIKLMQTKYQFFLHSRVKMASPPPSPSEEVPVNVCTDIFTGEKLRCLNEPLARECGLNSTYRGQWMGKKVGVRRLRVEDCHEKGLNIVSKHQDGSLSHDHVLKVIGSEEDGLGQWRYRITFP